MKRCGSVVLLALVATSCEPSTAPPKVGAHHEVREDRRPDVGEKSAVVLDLTAQAREQNAAEPVLPSRHGTVRRASVRPHVKKTETGFIARIPRGYRIETPAYHNGRVYAGAHGTYELHAMDALTGKSEFSIALSDDGPTAPACQDGICVFNTYSCTLFAVSADTGEYLWSWWLGSPQLATTVISGDMVLSSYPDRNGPAGAQYALAAFELKSGKPLWRRFIDGEVNSTPVAYDNSVYVATVTGKVYQFGARDGYIASVRSSRAASAPVVSGDSVIYPKEKPLPSNNVLAATQAILPEYENNMMLRNERVTPQPRPLIARERLIRVDSGVLVATHRTTGQELWTRELDGDQIADLPAPMMFAGESILLATASGNVVRMDPESGTVTDTFPLGHGAFSSPPIVHAGWIYAGTQSGYLVAFDTGDEQLTGWEMLGGGPARTGAVYSEDS